MIPLAQYLSDMQDGDFVPLRAIERRPQHTAPERPVAFGEMPGVRPVKSGVSRPAASAVAVMEPVAEKTVPLSLVEAEREAWAKEREALQAAANEKIEQAATRATETAGGEAEARIEALRTELAAEHAAALSAERERWTLEQADRLADLMILQVAVFEDTMRATVKSVLRPLAMDARQRRALDDLAEAVKMMAPENAPFKIAATGPSDLLVRFGEKLGDHAGRLVVKPDESRVDIRVEAEATTIETRMADWGKALEKALA
jgi:hypothetical protein